MTQNRSPLPSSFFQIQSINQMVTSEAPIGPPCHLIGTPTFFPSLLSYVHDAASSPSALPLDPVIFQSILLCLVAGDKHLILRTPEEDVGLVLKLAFWVSCRCFILVLVSFRAFDLSRSHNNHSFFPQREIFTGAMRGRPLIIKLSKASVRPCAIERHVSKVSRSRQLSLHGACAT